MEILNAGETDGSEASAMTPSLVNVFKSRPVMLESLGAGFSIETGLAVLPDDLTHFMFGEREAFHPMPPPFPR